VRPGGRCGVTRGPFVPIGLGDPGRILAARGVEPGDVLLGDLRFFPAFALALHDFDIAVKAAGDDVPVMEEGRFSRNRCPRRRP